MTQMTKATSEMNSTYRHQ